MNQIAGRKAVRGCCVRLRCGWPIFLPLVLAIIGNASTDAEDSQTSDRPSRRGDVVLSWCDDIEKDACSCLRRACVLRRAIQNGKLRLLAGIPSREFVFCFVPPGRVRIGLTDNERITLAREHGNLLLGHNSHPNCEADFVEGFFILDREVTHEQFNAVLAWKTEHREHKTPPATANAVAVLHVKDVGTEPKASLTWRDARDFCDVLRDELRFEVRLPLELEWEYAARGSSSSLYPGGNKPPSAFRDDVNDSGYAAIVRESRIGTQLPTLPNRTHDVSWCGVNDLSGNLSEWCLDVYQSSLKEALGEDHLFEPSLIRLENCPPDPKESSRAFRGASFGDSPLEAAAPLRRSLRESKANERIGFRPVLTLRFRNSKCELLARDVNHQNSKPQ